MSLSIRSMARIAENMGESEKKKCRDLMCPLSSEMYCSKYNEKVYSRFSSCLNRHADGGKCYIEEAKKEKADFDKKINDATEQIRLNPNSAEAYFTRYELYLTKDVNLALSDITQAIKLSPNNANYYTVRGTLYRKEQEFKDAVSDFEEALKIDPQNSGIIHQLKRTQVLAEIRRKKIAKERRRKIGRVVSVCCAVLATVMAFFTGFLAFINLVPFWFIFTAAEDTVYNDRPIKIGIFMGICVIFCLIIYVIADSEEMLSTVYYILLNIASCILASIYAKNELSIYLDDEELKSTYKS